MSPTEAEKIGTQWMRDEFAADEIEASISAARAALCRIAAGFWQAAEQWGADAIHCGPGPVLRRDLCTYFSLHEKLLQAGVTDPAQAALDDALALFAADEMAEGARALTVKVVTSLADSLRRAHDSVEASERSVTRVAEYLIAERAALGNYTIDDEARDYRHARELVYGARASARPMPTMTDEELDAALDALVE